MFSVAELRACLRLPVVCSPMFIISNPKMVIEQCLSGIVGSFPALNARPQEELSVWLDEIETALSRARAAGKPHVAPFAVNLVMRRNNDRLAQDLDTCERHRVPILITSLGVDPDVVRRVHDYGGLVFHDVTTLRHARSALRAGVDGLILVCAGAGGHAGATSPFALVKEVRGEYDGPIILAGAISTGDSILAAQVMGADFVYMGTRFIATQEAGAVPEYKDMILASNAADILYTPYFSGIPANYLKASVVRAGLDPDNLAGPAAGATGAPGDRHRRWKDIWGAGQGVGSIHDLPPTAELVDRLEQEYHAACRSWRDRLAPGA